VGHFKTEYQSEDDENSVNSVIYLHKGSLRPLLIIKHRDENNTPVFWVCSRPKEVDVTQKDCFRVEALHSEDIVQERELNHEVFYNIEHADKHYRSEGSTITMDELGPLLEEFLTSFQEYILFSPIHTQDMEEEGEEEEDRHCKRKK
jgi:hypothetical protein